VHQANYGAGKSKMTIILIQNSNIKMSRKIMNKVNIFFAIPQNTRRLNNKRAVHYLTGLSQNIVADAPYFAGQNDNEKFSILNSEF
jgi:hypothetical protein